MELPLHISALILDHADVVQPHKLTSRRDDPKTLGHPNIGPGLATTTRRSPVTSGSLQAWESSCIISKDYATVISLMPKKNVAFSCVRHL